MNNGRNKSITGIALSAGLAVWAAVVTWYYLAQFAPYLEGVLRRLGR